MAILRFEIENVIVNGSDYRLVMTSISGSFLSFRKKITLQGGFSYQMNTAMYALNGFSGTVNCKITDLSGAGVKDILVNRTFNSSNPITFGTPPSFTLTATGEYYIEFQATHNSAFALVPGNPHLAATFISIIQMARTVTLTARDQTMAYRFGFNTQMLDNNLAGMGNHLTAQYWEYDPRYGRRWNLDPVRQYYISQYACFGNNPIRMTDWFGDFFGDFHDRKSGEKIGTDGKADGKKYIAQTDDEEKKIKKNEIFGKTTEFDPVKHYQLPSDNTLKQTLGVIDRTQANGGKYEEGAGMYGNDSWYELPRGNEKSLELRFPDLPSGDKPVTSIHSHPTSYERNGESVIFHGVADAPSKIDLSVFQGFKLNIITGRLLEQNNGVSAAELQNPKLGAAFYGQNNSLLYKLSYNAIKTILYGGQ